MAKKKAKREDDEFTLRRVVYVGRRLDRDGKISDHFEIASVEGYPDDLTGRELSYTVGRNRPSFVIGQLYDVPLTEDFTVRLHDAEPTDYFADSDDIEKWSALDAAARHAKHVAGTRKRLEKEHRERWLEGMTNLRFAYASMSVAERRAMRQLVLEWLEERP